MAKNGSQIPEDVELSRAEFHIEGDFSNPDELEKIAWEAFFALKVEAFDKFDDNVGLKVHVEEGSAIGIALVVASIKVVYEAVGQYPDFKSGVKELANDGKQVAQKVLSITSVRNAKKTGNALSLHADSGTIGQVEAIINRVRNGKLNRQQGEELALELLERFGEIPQDTRDALQTAFRTMKVKGTQLKIQDEEVVERAKQKRVRRIREPRPGKSEWAVDIEAQGRNGEPQLSRRMKKK